MRSEAEIADSINDCFEWIAKCCKGIEPLCHCCVMMDNRLAALSWVLGIEEGGGWEKRLNRFFDFVRERKVRLTKKYQEAGAGR